MASARGIAEQQKEKKGSNVGAFGILCQINISFIAEPF